MGIVADLKRYGRFAFGLRAFLSHRISLAEAQGMVRQRMAERGTNFLRLVKRGILGYPSSPYLPLLKLAQCEMGDIQNMVHARGLEKTLRALREAGVYVSFEEFKGREPIVRDGNVFPVEAQDFDNPYLSHYYQVETGGTTGLSSRVGIDLEHLAAQASSIMLALDAHGVLDVPTAIWFGGLPDPAGVNNILRGACLGNVPQKWFSPVSSAELRSSFKFRLATEYILAMGQLFGVPIPRPEPVRLDQAAIVARWAAETVKARGACAIQTLISSAVRVAIAARKEELDLTGATFLIAGEPLTSAKVTQITCSGARVLPWYSFAEAGRVGMGCVQPVDCNDLHLFKDSLALIQCPREVPGIGDTVDAFYFTALLPTAPKVLLNVEIDDYGVVENRACGCRLESYGFTEHLRHIRSFRKLTGEGVTLVGSEMIRILEEVLPARFGGSALDYQLLEEEDVTGFTRLSILVSPKIEIADEKAVVEAVQEALRQSSVAADLARAIWSQAGTLRVRRLEPILTNRGKLMPLHLAQRPGVAPCGRARKEGGD